jgi:hypothetical protein
MDPVYAQIDLRNLHCHVQSDQNNPNNPAEPYLWVTFFKLDGATTVIDGNYSLRGTATVFPMPGNHGDLRTRGMKAGDDVAVPSTLGQLSTLVTPIPLETPFGDTRERPGVFGCVAVVLEEDEQSDFDTAYAHDAFNRKLTELLNNLIPTLGLTHPEIRPADIDPIWKELHDTVKHALSARAGLFDIFTDYDDSIGSQVFYYSQETLLEQGPIPLSMQFENKNRAEVWELTGEATARSANDLIVKAFLEAIGRQPSEEDIRVWIDTLRSYRMPPNAAYSRVLGMLISWVASMDGERERREMITRSYREVFGRAPWDTQMDSWFDAIRQTATSYKVLINAHIDWLISPAGRDEIGLVVDRAFDNALERRPQPSERDSWISRIRNERLGCQQIMDLL